MNKTLSYILIFLTLGCVENKKKKESEKIKIEQKEIIVSKPVYSLKIPEKIDMSSIEQVGEIKGNGIVAINPENYPTIKLYKKFQDKKPIETIVIFDDVEIKSFNIKNYDSIKDWFQPLSLHLDYYIFHLQCSAKKENWYEVIVNEKTNLKYWIKKTPDFSYQTWNHFISNVVAVSPKNGEKNPFLKTPDLDSEKHEKQLLNCLTPIEVTGDWMKVKVESVICDMTDEMDKKDMVIGYIRWRQDNKLLIDYYLTL